MQTDPRENKGLCFLQEFVKKLDLKKGDEVLDVGCGIGGSAFLMAQVGSRTEQEAVWETRCVMPKNFQSLLSQALF